MYCCLLLLCCRVMCVFCVLRPTELFRSCNVQSDQGAMSDFRLWSNGTIKMPFMNIPVLDIRRCRPEMWKAVACALQIKPCYSKSRGSVICRSAFILIFISICCINGAMCQNTSRSHPSTTNTKKKHLNKPVFYLFLSQLLKYSTTI